MFRSALKALPALLLITLLMIFLSPNQMARAEDQNIPAFVDFDGDGFNDNAPDPDGDGIPAAVESPASDLPASDIGTSQSQPLAVFDMGAPAVVETNGPNSSGFGSLSFAARALSRNRCSLDSDNGFGSSSGIGLGSLGGGVVCEGGVCHPR